MSDAKAVARYYTGRMTINPVRQQTLAQLTQACCDEQAHAIDGPCCFELVRRALNQTDGAAWQAFEQQFEKLFARWIAQDAARYGLRGLAPDEAADVWADARARFVTRYGGEHGIDAHFPHIGAVLAVLRKCIRSTLQERRRVQERQQRLEVALHAHLPAMTSPSTLPDTQVELAELRRCVQTLLRQDVPEDELRLLLDLRFGLDLKPRQIQARYPDQFPTVRAVHNGLDKVLKRLKRRIDVYTQRCL